MTLYVIVRIVCVYKASYTPPLGVLAGKKRVFHADLRPNLRDITIVGALYHIRRRQPRALAHDSHVHEACNSETSRLGSALTAGQSSRNAYRWSVLIPRASCKTRIFHRKREHIYSGGQRAHIK